MATSVSSSYGSPSFQGSSLLNPPNPSFAAIDTVPRGGILLNSSRRGSDSPQARPLTLPHLSAPTLSQGRPRSDSDSPQTPVLVSPAGEIPSNPSNPTLLSPSSPLISPSDSGQSLTQPRIRFAPLPDPNRPRSLSTGRNVVWKPTEGPGGETTRTVEIRGVEPRVEFEDDSSDENGNGAEFGEGKSGDESSDYDDKRGRRWSRTMGSWGKGTKKLFGVKDREGGYSEGAPLKKSVSTGGFIGSSPFRWTSETERRRSMQGLAPSSPLTSDHRRNASMEGSSGSPLSSSPAPVRMLNGRVYGNKRAVAAAERERQWREQNEPAFIEWGHGKQGAGLGSNQTVQQKGGFLGDAEEGSGMEWVKKRREEREKRRREEEKEKQNAAKEGFRLRSSSGGSLEDQEDGQTAQRDGIGVGADEGTPSKPARQTTPIIQVSQFSPPIKGPAPSTQTSNINANADSNGKPTPISIPPSQPTRGITIQPTPVRSSDQPREHVTQAIQVPKHADGVGHHGRSGRGVDIFGDGENEGSNSASGSSRGSDSSSEEVARPRGIPRGDDEAVVDDEDEEGEGDDEEEEEEEYGDGDFDDDDEDEEEDVNAVRTTSSAAGVEVVSRHKDKG